MKKMKKILSLLLVSAMIFGCMSGMAFAAEETTVAEKIAVEVDAELLKAGSIAVTEENMTEEQPLAAGTADSSLFRIPAMITLDNGDLLAAADARWTTSADWGGLDTIASVSSDNGKTWYYSFPIYFPDSNTKYPGMEVATTAIDPVIVQGNDGTIYCIADMNPSGITTGDIMPAYGTGYVQVDGEWRLALTATYTKPNENNAASYGNPANYEYYVGDFDAEGFAHVLNMADGSETVYVVDEWYNIYKLDETTNTYKALTQTMVNDTTVIQQNAFYKDSELHVFNTGYLWMVTSTDNGRSWGNPTILNTQIKRASDRALLASPGQGMVASNGDIIIPFYDHGDGQENASIIWSSDNGKTWTRSNDVAGMWSSESEMVEIYDGVLRLFYRNGMGAICYADFTKTGDTWVAGTGVNAGIAVTSTCNVTAITHSQEINGKKVVMVACPGGSGRANGKLFTFLVSEDNSMELFNTYSINTGNYAYSCMTEMNNGNIGLLWEDQAAAIRFDEIELDVVLGYKKNIVIDAGESYVEEKSADAAAEITQASDANIATVTSELVVEDESILLHDHVSNTKSSLNSFSASANVSLKLENAEFVLTNVSGNAYKAYNEATGKYLTKGTAAYTSLANNADSAANQLLLTPTTAADGSVTYKLCRASDSARYTVFYFTNMDFNSMSGYNGSWADGSYELVLLEKQEAASENDVIPGYTRATTITSGNTYLITYIWTDGSVIVLYPGENSTGGQAKFVGDAVSVKKNVITITGVTPGETSAVVDGILYDITVLDPALSPSYAGNDYPVEKLTATAGSEQNSSTEGPARFALDGNPATHFHSAWSPKCTDDQLWIQVELEEASYVTGLRYLPRANAGNGTVSEYEVLYSMDGENWTTGAAGKWAINTEWKVARLEEPTLAKFVRLFAVDSTGDSNGRHMSAGEVRVTVGEPKEEPTPTPDVSDVYPDVDHDAWYEPGVQYVYDKGIMSGSNGLFNPTGNITRAQVVATLYKLEGSPEVTDFKAVNELVDVEAGQWYTNAVCWAYNTGVATGNTTTKMFNMSNPVTRQQLATFFYSYAELKGLDTETRADISDMAGADQVAEYALDTMQWAVGTGLITGSETTVNGVTVKDLKPTGTASRAQVAAIIQRFCEGNNL